MASWKRKLERVSLDKEGGPQQPAFVNVFCSDIGWRIDSVRDGGPLESAADVHDVTVVRVEDDRPPRLQVFQQLPLGLGNLLDGPEKLDVHRTDVGVDADVGMGEPGQLGDLPFVIHPHLADHHFGVVGRVVDAERTADQIVEIAPGLEGSPLGADERGDHFLGGGLPGRAGDGDQKKVATFADGVCQLLKRHGRIGDSDHPLARRQIGRNLTDHDALAGLQGLHGKLMAVEAITLDGEED